MSDAAGPDPSAEEPPRRPSLPCFRHADRRTHLECDACGRWVCHECRAIVSGRVRCALCTVEPSPPGRLLLNLVPLAGASLLALAGLHRFLERRSWTGPSNVFPSLGITASFMSRLTWGDVTAFDRDSEGWCALATVLVIATGFVCARGDHEDRGRTWRGVLAVAFAGAALLVRSDDLARIVAGR